jgi:nitrogen-specific signal transduction histidine kinase
LALVEIINGNPDRNELVFALGHEIGNLLAATRMHTHIIDAETSADDLAAVATTIGELSSRMGSLLAQIRPLLSPASLTPLSIDPLDLLDGVSSGLEESCEERVRFDLKSAVDLPSAGIDPEPLHHILVTAIYQALEESAPGGKVVVSSEVSGQWLVLVIEGEGPLEKPGGAVLRGRALSHAVAEAILQERGGKVAVFSNGEGSRLEVMVPAVC